MPTPLATIPIEQLAPMLVVVALIAILVVVLIVTRRAPTPPSFEEYIMRQNVEERRSRAEREPPSEPAIVELNNRLRELESTIYEIKRMLEYRYPAFIQSGIVPSSLAEIAQLFNLQYLRVEGGGIAEEFGSLKISEESIDTVRRLCNRYAIIAKDDIVLHYVRGEQFDIYAVTVGKALDLKDLSILGEIVKHYYAVS